MKAARPVPASPTALAASPASGSLAGFCRTLDAGAQLYVRPVGLLPVAVWAAGAAVPLAGSRFAFTMAELIVRQADGHVLRATAPLTEIFAWGWERGPAAAQRIDALVGHLTRTRPPFAGLSLDRPRLMGIINVTPDSFSDGGVCYDPAAALAQARRLRKDGADVLDIGGESTRPGAAPVSPEVEAARIAPVLAGLDTGEVPVSVDTRHATTMRQALAAGVAIINDITACTGDTASLAVIADNPAAAVVLMHMQGEPRAMQVAPHYGDVALDVFDYLEERVAACEAAGIPRARIAVDPGIGFGKTAQHNAQLLAQLSLLHGLGCALLLGVSRKSFIAHLCQGEAAGDRLPGTLAAGLAGLDQGVHILRVHDIAATVQARTIWEALHPGAEA